MKTLAEILSIVLDVLFGRRLSLPDEGVEDYADPVAPVPPEPEGSSLDEDIAITRALEWGSASPLVEAMKRKGYEVFESDEQDLNLNIVGVRNTEAKVDEFGCVIHVFWKFAGKVTHVQWKATTYPGSRYLVERLLNPKGAAILVPGQYKDVYKLDLHGGRYRALCQRNGAVRVYRDGDRDREFDLRESSIMSGWFGINIHAPVTVRAGMTSYVANRVYAASAGCQVFQSLADFLEFRSLCDRAAKLWGNVFTYTLLQDRDLTSVSVEEPREFDGFEEWEPAVDTLGVRQKNLLNVKGADAWLYSLGRDSRGHHRFPTFAKGLRAGIINLRSYWVRHRLRTISGILSRWAPVSDTVGSLPGAPKNSPRNYSLFVSERMGGFSPLAPLSLFTPDGSVEDADQLYALVEAMAAYENKPALKLPRDVFDEALRLL